MSTVLIVTGVPLLAFLVYAFTNFLKALRTAGTDNGNAALTQIVAWAAAVGALFLFRASQLAESVPITDTLNLKGLNGWTTTLVGLLIGSGASAFYDFRKAIDNSDSAVVPPIVPNPTVEAFVAEPYRSSTP